MEIDNEPESGGAPGDSPVAAAQAQPPADAGMRRSLTRLLQKRVKKFIELAPAVSADAEPKTIHDVRVCSRRVQQAVTALFPKPRSGKVRRLRRIARRIRRALGEWRNCDVLLEMVARQQRRTRSVAKRRAWDFVCDYLLQKRDKEIARAKKKLRRNDVSGYAALMQRALNQSPKEDPVILMQRLRGSVEAARSRWQSAFKQAQETRAAQDLHALRIATKDLRYRIELLHDLGDKPLKAQLKRLAELQDAIGVWHDRQVLDQAVAEAVARPDILLNTLPVARLLLAELETARERQFQDIEKILALATEPPAQPTMARADDNHHSEPEPQTGETPGLDQR